MNFQTYTQKLETLKYYIEKKWATTPKTLSSKLQVSERTILRMVKCLKEQGVIICFSKKENSYYLKNFLSES